VRRFLLHSSKAATILTAVGFYNTPQIVSLATSLVEKLFVLLRQSMYATAHDIVSRSLTTQTGTNTCA